MNRITIPLATLAASAMMLAAFPASAVPNAVGGRVIPLKAASGSNEYGTVALKPLGQQTAVEVHVVNAPPGTLQTLHIHKGTCAKITPGVEYPLSPLVDGTSESIIDVPLAKLLASPLALHVHRSYRTDTDSLACASFGTH